MTLVLDNRSALKGGKGLHAFIVGVSHYKHLPGGHGETGTETYGLNQLTAAATSAYKLCEWLRTRGQHLVAPLATARLLLSPSAEETTLFGEADPCTWDNFADEAHRWRDDASANDDDTTFFYFAGHGIIRNRRDSVLLCEDFAQPRRGPLARAVELDNVFDGMAPPAMASRHIAHTQFYFIDACREFPEPLKNNERIEIAQIFESELGGSERRRVAPIFHSAVSGSLAYSIAGTQTLFSMALLGCLEGAGSEAMPEDDSGQVKWRVSVQSLNTALPVLLRELNQQYKTDQDYEPAGIFKDATIHYLDGPPNVDVTLKVVPAEAVPFIAVDVLDSGSKTVWQLSPVNPHPYHGSLSAGRYVVRATVLAPPQPPYVDRASPEYIVEPPSFVMRARPISDNS